MQSFIEFLSEQELQTGEQLAKSIEQLFTKYFKKSYIFSEYDTNLQPSITIRYALGKSKDEYPNGIIRNDPIYETISIFGFNKDGSQKGNFDISVASGSILVPSETPHKVFDYIKVWRKFSGDEKKILKGFDNYFKKLYDTVKQNEEKVQKVVGTLYKVSDKV